MLINWFTVAAQIVNFLVLVALLKKFLWDRLVSAIDEREKRITDRLAEADDKNKQAELLKQEARARLDAMRHEHDEIVLVAQREADEQRNAMIQRAREEVRGLEARWHQDLEREQTAFLNALKRRTATEMFTVIRRALDDLTGRDVQQCATNTFVEKLKNMDLAALRDLVGKELTVLSAQALADVAQREIRTVLEQRLGAPVSLQFQRAGTMPWGIELRGNGRRIGWTPDAYIDSLEQNLKEALEHRAELAAR
ncbi:MAG TPA: F0F1 ATP synthase subunit B [Bryobacteraceae bacterium]|nr:F0F1 ATP synthase subunit B [Bryobacteraceae bacterium]